jgi:hypothetical protein
LRVLSVIIYADGGIPLFDHSYDPLLTNNFRLTDFISFIDCFQNIFSVGVVGQRMQSTFFDDIMFVYEQFKNTSDQYGLIKYNVFVASKFDRTLPFDPQEIVLRHLAQYIAQTFFECYKEELSRFFRNFNGYIETFRGFRDVLDPIVEKESQIKPEILQELDHQLRQALNQL